MNINDFQNLTREEQFKAAGSIAGTEPSVFDGMWRTESGRGAAMLSPAGAEGHFGLMPKTRATMEGRFGSAIDPMNFGQSLFTAAHLMKENLGRFKNVPDALRAYNGGWTPSTWGNAETSAYAGKVLGTDEDADYSEETASMAAIAEPGSVGGMALQSARDLWDTPFQTAPRPAAKAPGKVSKVAAAVQSILPAMSAPVEAPTAAVFGLSSELASKATAKGTADKEAATLGVMAQAAAYHEPFNASARWALRDDEPVDGSFVPDEALLKGKTSDEQSDLRAATSQVQFDRMVREQGFSKDADSLAFKNGTAWGMGATLIAELPAAALSGGIVTGLFRAGRIGSVALAAEGRLGAALASSTAEGIAGNVATTALLDSIGERQGATAYALGMAGGLLNPLLGGRAMGRMADRATEAATVTRLINEAVAKEAVLTEKATIRAGVNATPEDIVAAKNAIEAEGVRAEVASHTAAVPESRKMIAGEVEDLDVVMTEDLGPHTKPLPVVKEARAVNPDLAQFPVDVTQFDGVRTGSDLLERYIAVGKDATNVEYARKLLASPSAREVKVEFVSQGSQPPAEIARAFDSGAAGLSAVGPDSNTVYLRTDLAQGLREDVLVHEVQHSLVVAALARNPEIAKEMAGLASSVRFALGNMAHMSEAVVTKAMSEFWSQAVKSDPAELLAYGLHSPYFREVFSKFGEDGMPFNSPYRKSVDPIRSGPKPDKVTEVAPQPLSLWQKFTDAIKRLLGMEPTAAKEFDAAQDSFIAAQAKYQREMVDYNTLRPLAAKLDSYLDQLLHDTSLKGVFTPESTVAAASNSVTPAALAADVQAFLLDPVAVKHGLDRMPLGTPAERAEAKQVLALYKKADSPEYVVDEARLSWLLKHAPAFSPTSNIMLRSKNPVVRMAALELLENGGGAGGRRSTASIAKYMNERAITGNAIVDVDRSFQTWFKTQPGASHLKEGLSGAKRGEYSRLVAEEIEQRGKTGAQRDFGQAVRNGADAAEASFERARLMQIDAKTVGWASLPETSRGYLPHKIKSSTYRELTPLQKRALHGELTDQFILVSGFDPSFSDQLASRYLDRVQHRALGGFDSPMGAHQVGASDVVKEALEAMGLTRPELDAAMKRYAAGGAGHTKKRLALDLSKEITLEDGSTFRLMDVYDTDVLSLIRGQSQRVSGEVALARHGVMGKPGLAILRRAMGYGGATETADRVAIDAFDQVSAEFLGSQFGVANKNVDRAVQLNSLMSLGGMGINQFAEVINAGTTLGVRAALQNITGFARLRAEILAMAKGQAVNNPLLHSIEQFGGAEFGTDAYKMVFPLDNPDMFANTLGADSLHWGDRILRGGGHLQSKLSLWRSIHSVQVRGVAEQIVMKASRALKDGVNDYHLRDMGMDDGLLARLRADMPNIAKYEGNKLVSFDITAATDKEAANAFVQSVHRGASQIIQGTFIGESGKYVHNSWLRMLSQFRSFSITAVDKQFNRQVGNRGVMGALFLTMGTMSVAAPIYMARTFAASIGRKDQEEYLNTHLSYGAIARSTTNYIATSGLGGDFLDAFTAVTGTGAVTGGRSGANTQFIGNMVAPAAGKVDKLWGAVQDNRDGTNVHGLLRELPLTRVPWFIPAINALGD